MQAGQASLTVMTEQKLKEAGESGTDKSLGEGGSHRPRKLRTEAASHKFTLHVLRNSKEVCVIAVEWSRGRRTGDESETRVQVRKGS